MLQVVTGVFLNVALSKHSLKLFCRQVIKNIKIKLYTVINLIDTLQKPAMKKQFLLVTKHLILMNVGRFVLTYYFLV